MSIVRIACAILTLSTLTLAADPPLPEARTAGLTLHVYEVEPMTRLQWLVPGQTPNVSRVVGAPQLENEKDFDIKQNFLAELNGFLNIESAGEYFFSLDSDDGSQMWIDGALVINHDGLHSAGTDVPAGECTLKLTEGIHAIELRMFNRSAGSTLWLRWRPPGTEELVPVPSSVLFTQANEVHVTSPGPKKLLALVSNTRPGDGEPVISPHPSFDLTDIHDDKFQPKVGGLDVFPDGRIAICTWDPRGDVFIIENPDDPARRKVTNFATGLAEPLGLKIVDGQIYVLQKQELTLLVDQDNDGVADEYRCVCDDWPVSANFHEFAFGLAYADGFFYANLAVAIDPGGRTSTTQPSRNLTGGLGRGQCIRINKETGIAEPVAMGIRTPNGIGVGPGGGIFVTDNQGDWLPANKLIRVRDGAFFGAHLKDDHAWSDRPVTPPIVWLPQGEIGNSPSQPTELLVGPWKGQVIHGDVTHGGLKRTFIETIDGVEQGCVFRFSQGFNGGVNRIAWSPDGQSLYVGQIGSTGNWGQTDKKKFGLQKLAYTGKPTFEPLAIRLLNGGFEIEFTEPLADGLGWEPTHYHVEQWRYQPTSEYGGSKLDRVDLPVTAAIVSSDRRKVFVSIDGLLADHVVCFRLGDVLRSETNQPLWTTEAWYTINRLQGREGGSRDERASSATGISDGAGVALRGADVSTANTQQQQRGRDTRATPGRPRLNTLTDREKVDGWKLLFNGENFDGWRAYGPEDKPVPDGWQIKDGAITRVAGGGDIMTAESYGDFELTLEWQIAPGGNSGLFFRVDPALDAAWHSGPEMQVLDNIQHPDGRNPTTGVGACYGLIAPPRDASLGPNRWNLLRVIAKGSKVQYWLNNQKLIEYDTSSDDWKKLVVESKFKDFPTFGQNKTGRIVVQDHGDRVSYRNLKLRPL